MRWDPKNLLSGEKYSHWNATHNFKLLLLCCYQLRKCPQDWYNLEFISPYFISCSLSWPKHHFYTMCFRLLTNCVFYLIILQEIMVCKIYNSKFASNAHLVTKQNDLIQTAEIWQKKIFPPLQISFVNKEMTG